MTLICRYNNNKYNETFYNVKSVYIKNGKKIYYDEEQYEILLDLFVTDESWKSFEVKDVVDVELF